ncbi:TetR/AcrR family transcriptional regulator [Reyranella sp. CPCC 100927]|uniref:TetR/AcrR family transcriptional regulator n=1 Tax=Reyranella sp. CPCC 100927 TaxID=2599616 RepID=UPI0015B6E2B3|nr:TetR/AcrR family transcriptional regulator [Reyranella sp. CPCC 100927]
MKKIKPNGPVAMGRNTKAGEPTRLRILDAAERLFAENGIDGTSLRGIMAAAKVSISQINYHFGTKEALLHAIFVRRAVPQIQARLKLLDDVRGVPPEQRLEELVRTYFAPIEWFVAGDRESVDFVRILARIGLDPSDAGRSMLSEFYDDFQHQVIDELQGLLPEVAEADIYWRWHCMLAILLYSMTYVSRLRDVSGGRYDIRHGNEFFEHVIPFLVTAIRTPSRPGKKASAARLYPTPNGTGLSGARRSPSGKRRPNATTSA